ncbi:MAG: hypothetical protein LH472_08170 [Pyrinomonadaceae bacterium]|nr:hypothetical protein [Pyrinomonadaceae bacterium]
MQVELIEQIIHLPIAERVEIIEKISRSVREELQENNESKSLLDERKAAYFRLRGALKMENPPMTKEAVREDYYNYLAEKYK